ncbi:5-oxoprolinase subunit PxpA [Kangiella taiwanensis]|uniref:5-oxoprolinase subunit PxpA n=1 Tax=Kangiella taiwanensis TaxID=1079179 RepID=A0ABP8I3Y7_9GAMM|nr:5-oxoprolinase subunit PxpA [Kangiella taiwanensis]
MKQTIDINCDLGESTYPADWAKDAKLMPFISSCNIACGGHAGNRKSIEVSVYNAKQHGLAVGAHPSYPDKVNFGRKSLKLSEQALRQTLREQFQLMLESCRHQEVVLSHVKPHGALYNDAAVDLKLATTIAEEIAQLSESIQFMGLAESAMRDAAHRAGLEFINEGFMDRNYQPNKTLVPRSEPIALHGHLDESLQQALNFAQGKAITTPSGQSLTIQVDSICLHGDNPDALNIAKQLNRLLQQNNIHISAGH